MSWQTFLADHTVSITASLMVLYLVYKMFLEGDNPNEVAYEET